MQTKKFFLIFLSIFGFFISLGFYAGAQWGKLWFRENFGSNEELMAFTELMTMSVWALIGIFLGLLLSLLLIRRLGIKFGKQLNEENELGKHPVLKLTLLSFLTFLFLLFFLAWLFSLKP